MTLKTGQDQFTGHSLEESDLKVQNQEPRDPGLSVEADTNVVPRDSNDSSSDMTDEQSIDSEVVTEQVEDIPVLEVSSRVQEHDNEEDNSLSIEVKRDSDDAEAAKENGSYRNDRIDEEEHAQQAGETTFAKPGGKIEPTLNQDYWVRIHGDRDVGRESVLAQFNESKASLTKISRIHGIKIPEKSWCDLEQESEDARFGDLIVTIQLADQNGSVNAVELKEFSNLVENLSDGTGRSFTYMAPIDSALLQAQAIADFVRYYDSIFVINIKPEQSDYLEGSLINRCANQLGLDKCDKQYFVRNKIMGKRKICLYSLANMSESGKFDFDNMKDLKTRGVTFFTKPAANRSPGAVFAEMVDTAKAFAGRVKGEAIAPNHEDLSQEVVDQIRQSIEKVAEDMEEHGMTPGSDEAMRIF
jgi:hypothetical protein